MPLKSRRPVQGAGRVICWSTVLTFVRLSSASFVLAVRDIVAWNGNDAAAATASSGSSVGSFWIGCHRIFDNFRQRKYASYLFSGQPSPRHAYHPGMQLTPQQRAEIQELLASGLTSHSTDGTSSTFDLEFLRDLIKGDGLEDPLAILAGRARPAMMTARINFRP
jgi:hypothetical protein